MYGIFSDILRVSVQGGVVILAVIVLRLLLKKAPRRTICLLWLLAGFRLLLPFQIESSFSLQPQGIRGWEQSAAVREDTYAQSRGEILNAAGEVLVGRPLTQDGGEDAPADISASDQARGEILDANGTVLVGKPMTSGAPAEENRNWEGWIPWIWLAGVAAMTVSSITAYLGLRKRVADRVILEEGVWVTGNIGTAFVLGFFRPQIYLPAYLTDAERECVLAHERSHIARRDHWWKLLGYAVLALHWFNPLVWLGYCLLCRDLEMACDEAVVETMDLSQRKAYSAALVSCSAVHRSIVACPVAFAEVSVKERVMHVLSYKKPAFWITILAVIAAVFVALFLLTSPEEAFQGPDIPPLTYRDSAAASRVNERFNPQIAFDEKTGDYESAYAIYHFDMDIPQEDRDACVFYTDGILARMGLEAKPDLTLLADYDGAWVDGNYLYLGGDFDSTDYAAKLIVLVSGGYASYGGAYGYADYIAVAEGWKEADDWQTHLTDNAARDLNWLCFREEFVSDGEIETNKNTAVRFARDYIGEHGEAAYQLLLQKSGQVETVAEFNAALSRWYEENGLRYTPTEILYSMGGDYHDYLVKCPYATFYLPENWDNRWTSEITGDDDFLHKSYDRVKHCFEANASYMAAQQERMGFDSYDNDLTVEFMSEEISGTTGAYRLIRLNSIEDLPILYIYWLTWGTQRTRIEAATYPYYLYAGMADYIAVTAEHPYEAEWLRYCGKNGLQAQLYQEGDCNTYIRQILKDETDPAVIQRTRWDFGSYYFEDYYEKPGNGLGTSFVWYLIDKYGFETMFDFVYETGREPIALDLPTEQKAWIAYLEEKYGIYRKYSQIPMEIPQGTDISTQEALETYENAKAEELRLICFAKLQELQSQDSYHLQSENSVSSAGTWEYAIEVYWRDREDWTMVTQYGMDDTESTVWVEQEDRRFFRDSQENWTETTDNPEPWGTWVMDLNWDDLIYESTEFDYAGGGASLTFRVKKSLTVGGRTVDSYKVMFRLNGNGLVYLKREAELGDPHSEDYFHYFSKVDTTLREDAGDYVAMYMMEAKQHIR